MLTVQAADFYTKTIPVARHYGFLPLELAVARELDTIPDPRAARARAAAHRAAHGKPKVSLDACVRHFEQGLSKTFTAGLLPKKDPLLYFTSASMKQKGGTVLSLGLHTIGSRHSIAEALVLRATLSMLDELGVRTFSIRMNGVGDRDSHLRYVREASLFLKKRFADLPPALQALAREDIYRAILALAARRDVLASELPRPVEYLTTPSRRHFRDVLEFIESNNVTYELDDLLLGPRECFSHILYEIDATFPDGSTVRIGRGGRYDELARTLFRVATPAVGLVLELFTPDRADHKLAAQVPQHHEPQVCLIHVGTEARIKSFRVIETFRKARIPVEQCFRYERLSDQLAFAERIQAPFVVIVGQKEALEGVAIVRNAATRAQQTVSIESLPIILRAHVRA